MERNNPTIARLTHFPKPVRDGLELLRDLIVENVHPEMIILFGSLATRKWTWKSDIDVLIVAETHGRPHLELELKHALSASDRLKKHLARIISPVVISPQELNEQLQVGQYS